MSHISLDNLTLKNFHEGLIARKFKTLEVVETLFEHIKETDKKIGAYLSLNQEAALRRAEEVDLALERGKTVGPLAGAPLAIKDNILVKDLPATAASRILENYRAAYDAGVIRKLRKGGAIFLGKTNLDEFAMGSSTENSAFKITRNPHDPKRVPGGSSGGSAAAVAAEMAVGALGSDTGGSIRQPAALSGVVGLKPTYGAVSRSGLIALASSLDQIGPLTKTVSDAELLFRAISGYDSFDATSVPGPAFRKPRFENIKKFTIGLPREYLPPTLQKDVRGAIEKVVDALKSLGVKFKDVSLPHTKYALSAYYIILPAEASANLARYDGIRYSRIETIGETRSLHSLYLKERGRGFGSEVKRRIILGTFVLSSGYYDAYYKKAQQVRTLIRRDFDNALGEVDILLTPVSPTPAFAIGEKTADPLTMYLSDIFTLPVNLAGLPAISIPVRGNFPLPVGFQLIGRPFGEGDILALGEYYEKIYES